MKLVAIIEDASTNEMTELYVKEKDGKQVLSGFSVQDGILKKPSFDVLKIFEMFKLGSNIESKGHVGEYDLVLDKDSGLIHYFKDGVEDFTETLLNNGRCVERAKYEYKPYRGKRPSARQYFFNKVKSVIILSYSLFLTLGFTIPNTNFTMSGERVNLGDGIEYVFDSLKDGSFDRPIEAEDVRDYIYNKSRIDNPLVKDFLWNPELINDVLPHYHGTFLDIVSKIRHLGLDVSDFGPFDTDDERIVGEYRFGNTIFVRDYVEEEFTPNDFKAESMAHEYIHMLQTSSVYPFICEASAEIIAQEYFNDTTSARNVKCYSRVYRYVQVIMEIIGSDPVWENNFRQNSTSFDDSVRPYLNDDEYREFIQIMNIHPSRQIDILETKFSRLESLLNTLHTNKYGFSMYEDEMIKAILSGDDYSRVYFKSSLREKKRDYVPLHSIDFEEALRAGEFINVYTNAGIVDVDVYLNNRNNPAYNLALGAGCHLSEDGEKIIFEVPEKKYVEPITMKFKSTEMVI